MNNYQHNLSTHLQHLLDGRVDVVLHGVLAEEELDGEGPARDRQGGHVPEEAGELPRVHGGRGHDQLQVLPPGHHLPEEAEQHISI